MVQSDFSVEVIGTFLQGLNFHKLCSINETARNCMLQLLGNLGFVGDHNTFTSDSNHTLFLHEEQNSTEP